MAHLVKHGFINSNYSLDKAQCDICGKLYSLLKEAKDCETKHFSIGIINQLEKELKDYLWQRILSVSIVNKKY